MVGQGDHLVRPENAVLKCGGDLCQSILPSATSFFLQAYHRLTISARQFGLYLAIHSFGRVPSMLWFPAITRRTGPKTIRLRERPINLVRFPTRRHRPHSYLEPTGPTPVNSLAECSRFRLNHSRRNLCCHRRRDSFGYRDLNLLAQIYAFGYMEMDWGWARLFSLMGLFEAGGAGICVIFFSSAT